MQVSEITRITQGKLLSGDLKTEIDLATVSTDSRTIKKGEFFLPLKGNNFNGEEFIEEAFKKGAVGAFTTKYEIRNTNDERLIIQVEDTTEALQRIAHAHRMKFRIPVIGIAGSNGKTTVKDMIAKALSAKYNVLKNEGTKNNHIGVPLTLLKLKEKHDLCVLEAGTNHKGEIRLLADIARPNIAVITNIGPSHLEFLKDLKGVFESKKEIFEFLDKEDLVILNGDDEYLSKTKPNRFKIIRFGFNNVNDFYASKISAEKGKIKFLLNNKSSFVFNLVGIHNIYNALAAIAAARHFKLSYESIKRELKGYEPAYMRLNVKDMGGIVIIDDVYNSNPLSMRYAIETIKSYPAKSRWIVSADMLELGEKENYFHKVVGEAIAKEGFDGLVTFGNLSRHTASAALESGMPKNKVWHCSNREEVAATLCKVAKAGDCILVKGSRAMKMEEVIEKFKGLSTLGS